MYMKNKTNMIKNIWWVTKTIVQYNPLYLFVIITITIILGVLPPISTIMSQNIMNGIQKRANLETLLVFVFIYIGIDLIQGLINYFTSYYKFKFAQGYNLNISQKVLKKAAALELKSYENSEIYNMISRAQYEVEGKLLVFFELFIGIISSTVMTISYLLIILEFRLWILLCVLVVPCVKFLINNKINRKTFLLLRERTNDSRKCWYFQHLVTAGEAYKELKIYNLFNYFIEKYRRYKEKFNYEDLKLRKTSYFQLGGATFFETMIDGIIFFYIILCGYSGEILIGNVVTYMKTITQIKTQITAILQSLSQMNQESMFVDQLIEYLNLSEEEKGAKHHSDSELINIKNLESIEVKNLYYRYKEDQNYVLKNISFKIEGTQSIAIVGPNGSGKTTLLKILMGFYHDYEGEILINGIEFGKINKESVTKRIATMFQDFYKYEATFRENIAYGNLNLMQEDDILEEFCKKFKLDGLINETPEKLDCQIGYWFDGGKQISLGQWQKIGITRAFSKDADLYIMDEPNAALDAISEYNLSKLYSKLINQKKEIIVAHKFNNLVMDVDNILVLDCGEIIGNGTHEELLKTNQLYKSLFEIQTGIMDEGDVEDESRMSRYLYD